jgi:hypothetical protein
MMEADTIEELKQKYPDEWIIVEVLERDDLGRVKEAKLLGHSRNKGEVDNIMMEYEGLTFTFFSGEIPPRGHALAL